MECDGKLHRAIPCPKGLSGPCGAMEKPSGPAGAEKWACLVILVILSRSVILEQVGDGRMHARDGAGNKVGDNAVCKRNAHSVQRPRNYLRNIFGATG